MVEIKETKIATTKTLSMSRSTRRVWGQFSCPAAFFQSVSLAILVHRWHQSQACVLALNSPHSKTPGAYFGASVSRSALPPPRSSLFLLLSLGSVFLPNLMVWLKLAPHGLVYKAPRGQCLYVSHIGFGVGFSSWPPTTPQTWEMVSVAMFLGRGVSRNLGNSPL